MIVAGIDAGTKATKLIVLKNSKRLCSRVENMTGLTSRQNSEIEVLAEALSDQQMDLSFLDYAVATGVINKDIPYIKNYVGEAIALTTWMSSFNKKKATILDVGYQKVTAVKCAENLLLNAITEDKCAAGTGIYLEMIADVLDINTDSIDKLAVEDPEDLQVDSACAVFAETEIISLLYQQKRPADIFAAAIKGLANRIYSFLLKIRPEGNLYIVGGYASNRALVKALEQKVGSKVIIPECPQMAAAYGAALLAERYALRHLEK